MTTLEESRALARLLDKKNHIFLDGVSWEAYQAILDELEKEGRRLRHTYDRGRLEIMTRSFEHESPKELLGAMIMILAEELNRDFAVGGELTLMREAKRRGIEPDQCYWIANERRVRGKTRIDYRTDPPPDLFVEIEVSRTIINRLKVLAALGVAEVWRFSRGKLLVGVLQPDEAYRWGRESPSFPEIDIAKIARFLRMARTASHLTVLREFRKWVRTQLRNTE